MARRAASLTTLVDQVNALYPNRSKASDGWIGDSAHSSTVSQHNPNSVGVVTAQDITHDPAHGADMNKLIAPLIADNRTWYVIFNRRIYQDSTNKPYSGPNPHDKHLHISTKQTPSTYDNPNKWNIGGSMDVITTAQQNELVKMQTGDFPGPGFNGMAGNPGTQANWDKLILIVSKLPRGPKLQPGTATKLAPGKYLVE